MSNLNCIIDEILNIANRWALSNKNKIYFFVFFYNFFSSCFCALRWNFPYFFFSSGDTNGKEPILMDTLCHISSKNFTYVLNKNSTGSLKFHSNEKFFKHKIQNFHHNGNNFTELGAFSYTTHSLIQCHNPAVFKQK